MHFKFLYVLCFVVQVSYGQEDLLKRKGSCEGLENGQADRIDIHPDTMSGIPQVRDQGIVTDPVATRRFKYGYRPFGSCATFTSIARVSAILKKEGLPIPPEFEVSEDNIRRFFVAYGDGYGKGIGFADVVTGNILNEYIEKHCKVEKPKLSAVLKRQLVDFEEMHRLPEIQCEEEVLVAPIIPKICSPEIISKYFISYPEKNLYKQKIRTKSYKYKSSQHEISLNQMKKGLGEYFNSNPPTYTY